ncbi:MAG: hypothetical protein Q9204_008742, partial [Flavoplaca sp. TL-2023a]
SSDNSNYLQPPLQSPMVSSPSDIADPSPIAPSSNGTDFDETGLDPDEVEQREERPDSVRRSTETTPSLRQSEPELKLDTEYAAASNLRPRSDEDEQPTSVIHAPQGFEAFVSVPSESGPVLAADTSHSILGDHRQVFVVPHQPHQSGPMLLQLALQYLMTSTL